MGRAELSMSVWAVVVGAGRGRRFGGPKQFEPLAGRPIVVWSLDTARATCDGVVLVLPPDTRPGADLAADAIVTGGATRSASVRAGLACVPDEAEIIVVHDAVRPLASPELFHLVVKAVRDGADGAVPAIPPSDALKRVSDGVVVADVDRAALVAVQTPQAFRSDLLRRAHEGDPDAPDDAALVEAIGATVRVEPGERQNLKITHPADLLMAEALIAR